MKPFTNQCEVRVADRYLNDESTQDVNTSTIATVFQVPTDEEMLVGIQYEGGVLDYVPQDVLDIIP